MTEIVRKKITHVCIMMWVLWIFPLTGISQYDSVAPVHSYQGGLFYTVEDISPQLIKSKKPENIILMIGDGMGVGHIHAALVANNGVLYLNQFTHIGFSLTHSSDDFVTDSGAGGTAIATGIKTYNGAIGVGPDSLPVPNLSEQMQNLGKKVGMVVTSSITHATPASFIAHQLNRDMHYDIAVDLVHSYIDVFIGGGRKYFENRLDSLQLIQQLGERDYKIVYDLDEMALVQKGKLAALLAKEHLPYWLNGRGDMLPKSTKKAISLLNGGKKGFFLMVEGSQIDWGAHDNHMPSIVTEMLDFDRAIGEALQFAAADGNTLVIVTADHETGGLALHDGNYITGTVLGSFTSSNHTGTMVPVFAFGPGAESFTGIFQNTDIHKKIMALMEK